MEDLSLEGRITLIVSKPFVSIIVVQSVVKRKAIFLEHKFSTSMKGGEILDQLEDSQILEKNCVYGKDNKYKTTTEHKKTPIEISPENILFLWCTTDIFMYVAYKSKC